jgi:serine/threonine protein kinase
LPSRASSRLRAAHSENSTSALASHGAHDVRDVAPLPLGAVAGDFEVAGVIHRGEAGFVYVAVDRTSLTKIAVKEYLPIRLADRMADGSVGVRSLRHQTSFRDGMQGFLRQARILAEVDAPALFKPLRTWQQHGTAYMAMPLCEGRPLEKVLRDSPRPSEPWLKTLLGPLLDALATLHRVHCYPCDVTPKNVVIGDGGPLLVDIGIVRRILARTPGGQVAPVDHGYAAIEQYSSDPSMREGPWTDVYAVAALVHLAVTGNPPASPVTRIDSDTLPLLSKAANGYSESFLDGVDCGLAVRPQQRPLSIADFREALGIRSLESVATEIRNDPPAHLPPVAHARAAEPGHSPPQVVEQPATPPPQATRKRRLDMSSRVLGGSLIVVALAGLGLRWTADGPGQPARGEIDPASIRAAPASEQPSPRSVDPELAAPANLPPTPTISSAASDRPAPAGESAHGMRAATATSKPAAAGKTGKVQFAIKPWGEIVVDGKKRGVSPPMKELWLPEGRHRIEIRNGSFSGYAGEVEISAGRSAHIVHSFTSP